MVPQVLAGALGLPDTQRLITVEQKVGSESLVIPSHP